MKQSPLIDGQRLLDRLDAFAAIGATAGGGVDRQALTGGDRLARQMLAELALARGFVVEQDAIANLFIRRKGGNPEAAPFLIGSHLDSQPTGGRFDGALGTLAAFEVLEALEDAGIETACPVEVVAWTNEEGSRFAPGSMGSQAYVAGRIDPAVLAGRSTDGALLADELKATLEALPQAPMRPLGGRPAGYLEVHIEQGPILENEGIPIGAVTGVQATRWLSIRVEGDAAHAGTTPLGARRDPMHAATVALAELYTSIMPTDEEARFTVGRLEVQPGSINAIPSSVAFSIDLRHPDAASLDRHEAHIRTSLAEASARCGCRLSIERIFDMAPALFDKDLLGAVEDGAVAAGVTSRRLVSGAFHDALFINRIAPAGMIFVPCRGGVSHNANEFVEPEFSVLGARVLMEATLLAIDRLANGNAGSAFAVAAGA